MCLDATRPAGPEFLANVAEQNLHSGLMENATEFRVRAKECADDKRTIDDQARLIQSQADRLAAITSAVAAS